MNMLSDAQIGENIRQRRVAQGLTQADVCEAARRKGYSLHESDLSKAEGGRFGWRRLKSIAAGLGIDIHLLTAPCGRGH